MANQNKEKLIFTLAGKLVSKSKEAHLVWLSAMRSGQDYLVPQALSVQRQLKAAGQ